MGAEAPGERARGKVGAIAVVRRREKAERVEGRPGEGRLLGACVGRLVAPGKGRSKVESPLKARKTFLMKAGKSRMLN